MAHFPEFKNFIKIMIDSNSDREHFCVTYAKIQFDIIISIDVSPFELLIGAKGTKWASVMDITSDYEISMPDKDFYALKCILDLKSNGIEKFGSYIFLKYIANHIPDCCSDEPIQPHIMQCWYPQKINIVDPEQRTIFYRWVDQTIRGNHAHNFEKTEVYFGKHVADYCRKHNITSQWVTPKQAEKMHIQVVKYPWTKC